MKSVTWEIVIKTIPAVTVHHISLHYFTRPHFIAAKPSNDPPPDNKISACSEFSFRVEEPAKRVACCLSLSSFVSFPFARDEETLFRVAKGERGRRI